MVYQNLTTLLEDERDNKPWLKGLPDDVVYSSFKEKNPNHPDLWEDIDRDVRKNSSGGFSPNAMNGFASMFDWGIDEESAKWMKLAYNRSLTGITELLFKGNERYDLNAYNPSVLEDIGATALSFMMPIDLLVLRLGGFLAKGPANLLAKGLGYKSGVSALGKKVLPARMMAQDVLQKTGKRALLQGVQQGTTLAVFEGAVGGVQAAINGEDVIGGITSGVIHGSIMGGFAGLAGGGLMAKHSKLFGEAYKGKPVAIGRYSDELLTPWQYTQKHMTGVPGQLLAESAVFTAPNTLDLVQTPDYKVSNLLVDYAKNIGLFGILKAKHHVFEKAVDYVGLHEKKFGGKEDKDLGKSHDKVNEDISTSQPGSVSEKAAHETIGQIIEGSRQELLKKLPEGISKEEYSRTYDVIKGLKAKIDSGTFEYTQKEVYDALEAISRLKGVIVDLDKVMLKESAIDTAALTEIGRFEEWRMEFDKVLSKVNDITDTSAATIKEEASKVAWPKSKIDEVNRELGNVIELSDYNMAESYEDRLSATRALKQERGELHRQEVELKKAETGVAGQEELLAKQRKMVREELGKADVEEARKTVDRIAAEKAEIKDSEKDAKLFLNRQAFDKENKNYIEPQSKDTNAILVDWINTIATTKSTNAKNITDFLKEIGKREIKDITGDDIKTYINNKVAGGIKITVPLTNIANMLEHASNRGFIQKIPITRKQIKNLWNKANEQIKIRGEEIKTEIATIAESRGGPEKTLKDIDLSVKDNKSETAISMLHGVGGFGLRTGEINKLKPENLIKDGDYYALNLTPAVAKSYSREVPISKETYHAIIRHMKANNIKKGETLFPRDIAPSVLKKSGIDREMKEKGLIPKLESISRKLVEGIWKGRGKVSGSGVNLLKAIMGHERWSDKIYGVPASPPQKRKINIAARELLEGKIDGEQFDNKVYEILGLSKEQLQLESQSKLPYINIKEQRQQEEYVVTKFKKNIPNLEIKLGESLGEEAGQRVLDRTAGYLVRIAKGEVREDTIPHSVAHVFTNLIESVGTPQTKRILRDGLNIVKKHYAKELSGLSPKERQAAIYERLNQTVGEMSLEVMKTDPVWEKITGKKAPLYKKISRVIKKFWSHLKDVFGISNERDIARLMAEGFRSGEMIPKVGEGLKISKVEWLQKDSNISKLQSLIHISEKSYSNNRQEILEARKKFNLPSGKGSWAKGLEDGSITPKMFDEYYEYIRVASGSKKPVEVKLYDIDSKYDVKPEERIEILKSLGVKDGFAENIRDKNTSNRYHEIVSTFKNERDMSSHTTDVILGALQKDNNLSQSYFRRIVVDPFHIFRDNISEKLASKMLAHDRDVTDMVRGYAVKSIESIVKFTGRRNLNRLHLYEEATEGLKSSDGIGRLERAGLLSKADKVFIKELNTKGSDARKAVAEYRRLTRFMWKELFGVYKRHLPEISFKEFQKEFGEKFVNNYFTYQVRTEALEYLTKKDLFGKRNGKWYDSYVKEAAYTKARSELKDKKNIGAKEIDAEAQYWKGNETFIEEVKDYIFDSITYSSAKISNKYLFSRTVRLPETLKINKNGNIKTIRTYENNFAPIIESYILGMSKYLATAKHFPEFTEIGKKYKVSGYSKADLIEKGYNKGGSLGRYAYDILSAQLGLSSKYSSDLVRPVQRVLAISANIFAATGLSSPLSGLKNIVIGQPRSVATFGLKNSVDGIKKLTESDTWEWAKEHGIEEYGSHQLQLAEKQVIPGIPLSMATWFKWVNLMTPSENVNRISSAVAGELSFKQHYDFWQSGAKGKKRQHSEHMFREVWKFSKDQIDMFSKNDIFDSLWQSQNKKTFDSLMRQVWHESHISTQGGTSAIRLPQPFSAELLKPFTLFQRIATSVTIDSYYNYILPAVKYKNFAPIIKAAAGHALAGAALYTIYDELIGKEPPKSQSNLVEKATMYIWRGEFLGSFGELIRPYDDTMIPIMEPVIARNLKNAFTNLSSAFRGTKTYSQAVSDFTGQSIVLLSQGRTIYENMKSPEYENHRRIRTLSRTFREEAGYFKPIVQTETERMPFYRNLRDDFLFGSKEEVVRSYWNAMNFMVTEMAKDNIIDPVYASKKAHEYIVRSIKQQMNPINLSSDLNGREVSKRDEFLSWIKEPDIKKMALNAEKHYMYKLRNFENLIKQKAYQKANFVYPFLEFDYKGKYTRIRMPKRITV